MSGLEVVLAALGIIVLLGIASFVALVLIVRHVYRRIRYSRRVDGALMRGRAKVSRGPQRTILDLRVRLDDALASGQAAVDLAAKGPGPRGEFPGIFRRICEEGASLDAQLRLMESEIDRGVLTAELPAAEERVGQVEALVRRIRSAVASALAGASDDGLTGLRADVDREVAALRAGVEELHALSLRDTAADPIRQPTTSTVRDPAAVHDSSPVRDKGNRP
ncbi:hypothetical protein GCM10017608_27870 [Agromyces luteolus]|uniref:Secreted protein n=1 Tax=Agromyces luteolus TaxID=88373 RepID=A0A7C9HPK7_9MICO|nr:hypothetical protein [Agromyces luteolus]MUN06109.1 hypothetical protein [Agromyces luteolus]GLK28852.1 hypothetical protein GCM10017608_27870 [Agromyces luteolus]